MNRKHSSPRCRRRAALAVAGTTLLLALVMGAPGVAGATMSGPCAAQVQGQDVSLRSASDTGDAIEVGRHDRGRLAVDERDRGLPHPTRVLRDPLDDRQRTEHEQPMEPRGQGFGLRPLRCRRVPGARGVRRLVIL